MNSNSAFANKFSLIFYGRFIYDHLSIFEGLEFGGNILLATCTIELKYVQSNYTDKPLCQAKY